MSASKQKEKKNKKKKKKKQKNKGKVSTSGDVLNRGLRGTRERIRGWHCAWPSYAQALSLKTKNPTPVLGPNVYWCAHHQPHVNCYERSRRSRGGRLLTRRACDVIVDGGAEKPTANLRIALSPDALGPIVAERNRALAGHPIELTGGGADRCAESSLAKRVARAH